MKSFISHKVEDKVAATIVSDRIKSNGLDIYLDVFEPVNTKGQELTEHIKTKLHDCNNLIVIISSKTKDSWWVPWEIGIASEREYPLASFFMHEIGEIPEYLCKWPYLLNINEVDIYCETLKNSMSSLKESNFANLPTKTRKINTNHFYRSLKLRLGR